MENRNQRYMKSGEASEIIIGIIVFLILMVFIGLLSTRYLLEGHENRMERHIEEYENRCANAGLSGRDCSNNNIWCKTACERKGLEFGMTSRNTFEACICMDGDKPIQIY